MYTIINKYKFRQKYADVNQTPVPKHSGAGQSQISEACLDDVPEIFEASLLTSLSITLLQ